ncbi:hypothetical protein TIFTF001_048251 [Ficus carica]|uniref:Uncharacterized protein n=1 Tax=Ficus carica TaxID=3494 RepID=A0AA88CX56_FICCA|nr:hypothetical protein TIFTF001_048251 [Ficus carica]
MISFPEFHHFSSQIPFSSGDLQTPPLLEKMANDGDLQMARSGGSGGKARRKPICCGVVIRRLRWLVMVPVER